MAFRRRIESTSTIAHMARRRIRVAGWLALLSLVFSQIAVAAYACPLVADLLGSAAAVTSDHEGCNESSPDYSALCLEHLKSGQSSVDKPGTGIPVPTPTIFWLPASLILAPLEVRRSPPPRLVARSGGPPPFALIERLRL